ncbi:MAG: STAS domain-containing protein [Planctomycetota bacterium]|jgi:anti-anti-sigma factor
MNLVIKENIKEPGVIFLSPVGQIDTDSSPVLEEKISSCLTESIKTLVIDLQEVDFITSAGVGVMTKAKALLDRNNGSFAMINLQPQIKKVFEIMRLVPTLNVFANIKELDEYLVKVQRKMTGQEDEF